MKMPKTSQLAKDLFSLFETAWAGSHTSVQGDAGTRQRMLDNPPERRPCCDAGMCICDAAGKQLCIMRKAFDRHLAKVCCPGSRHRKQLVDCELVVFFVGRSRELIATAGGLADGASADSSDHRGELLVGHISDQSISPWQTWFQKGSTDHPFDFKSLRFDVETVRIQIKGEFWRRYFWLQQLDRSLHWGMLVFEVVWKATMLGTLLPDTLDLRCIAGQDEPLVIWDPFTKKGQERKKKDPGAWAKTLAEASDSSSAAGDAAHESDVPDDAAEVEPEPLEDDEPEGIDPMATRRVLQRMQPWTSRLTMMRKHMSRSMSCLTWLAVCSVARRLLPQAPTVASQILLLAAARRARRHRLTLATVPWRRAMGRHLCHHHHRRRRVAMDVDRTISSESMSGRRSLTSSSTIAGTSLRSVGIRGTTAASLPGQRMLAVGPTRLTVADRLVAWWLSVARSNRGLYPIRLPICVRLESQI